MEVEWIAQEHNAHVDALAGLALVYQTLGSRTVIFDEVETPSFKPSVSSVLAITFGQGQMDPIVAYLENKVLPKQKRITQGPVQRRQLLPRFE